MIFFTYITIISTPIWANNWNSCHVLNSVHLFITYVLLKVQKDNSKMVLSKSPDVYFLCFTKFIIHTSLLFKPWPEALKWLNGVVETHGFDKLDNLFSIFQIIFCSWKLFRQIWIAFLLDFFFNFLSKLFVFFSSITVFSMCTPFKIGLDTQRFFKLSPEVCSKHVKWEPIFLFIYHQMFDHPVAFREVAS